MEESGDGYNIRFRHVCGDFGPFLFPKASTVWTLKEKLLEEWAKVEMTGSAVAPKSAAELRIIFGGHMLENQKLVKDLQTAMGNPQGQKVVTMHVVVRPPSEEKGIQSGAGRRRKGRESSSCCVLQ